MKYKVAEKFVSINGEGTHSGELAVFIRFGGCNLNCMYCDTKWANEKNTPIELMSATEIYNYIKNTGVRDVTLTGGEPLLQDNIKELLEIIAKDKALYCEIETNGSIDLKQFSKISNRPSFTMDYKLPASGMTDYMLENNFDYLNENDTVKFVCGNLEDLKIAKDIINKFDLTNKCNVFLSPVFGDIPPDEIVEFMKENRLNKVRLQLQIHKIIWDPNKKGV